MPIFYNEKLNLTDACIYYIPNFINSTEALQYFKLFKNTLLWQQDHIKVFGKTFAQPRLTAFYSENDKNYSYSNITMKGHAFTPDLIKLKNRIEEKTNETFNSCLANLYRNGQDSNGWHADNEKSLGLNPCIASLSFGEARYFYLKHKKNPELKTKLLLQTGSLLLMKNETQHNWLHQIPKTKRQINSRINLTFRTIL